jgi:hypothetical protein
MPPALTAPLVPSTAAATVRGVSDETLKTTLAIIGACSPFVGLLGVLLGARLSKKNTLDVMEKQREWDTRLRQAESAARLNTAVMGLMTEAPQTVGRKNEVEGRCQQTWALFRQAQQRETLALTDAELDRRASALDMILYMGTTDAGPGDSINPWCISVAARELRMALDAFQLNRDPPDADFPTARELIGIVHPNGRNLGFDGVNRWLSDRNVM